MEFVPRLRTKYLQEIVPAMIEQFQYKSIMEVPKLVKISLNQGISSKVSDKKMIESSLKEMTAIAGQKAVPTTARLSVSNFKLREGMVVGVRTTLRKDRMHEFLDRFVSITLPRVRDFRGISDKSFDGRGNYSMGITEHIIFPEIDLDKINKITGMDITFVTTAKTDAEALALLKFYGMPFKNQNKNN